MIEIKKEQLENWIKEKKVRARYGNFETTSLLSLFNEMQDPKKQENLDLSGVPQEKVIAMRKMKNDIVKGIKSNQLNHHQKGQSPER